MESKQGRARGGAKALRRSQDQQDRTNDIVNQVRFYPAGSDAAIDLRSTRERMNGSDVAVVHEWVAKMAGSEQVFQALSRIFPSADLYAFTKSASVEFDVGDRTIHTTAIDRLSSMQNRRALLLPLMPILWRTMKTPRSYDVVITSSHAFSRFFPAQDARVRLCYCHAPMRYVWTPELDGRGTSGGLAARAARWPLKKLDRSTVDSVTSFASNSSEVRDRVRSFYGRDSRVIPPPVDVEYFGSVAPHPKEEFVLTASRWVPYKRMDLAIDAAAVCGVPLVLAGGGPEEKALRDYAGQRFPGGVTFVVEPDRETLRSLMQRARAFIFPAHEDFGIIPIEAQATGTPILALAHGGSLDTVHHGTTGVLVDDQTPKSFAAGLAELLALDIEADHCRQWAGTFGHDAFASRIAEWFRDDAS